MRTPSTLIACLLLAALGCSRDTAPTDAAVADPTPAPVAEEARSPSGERPLVVFLGDSLTAGYGLSEEEAFPALAAELLAAAGRPIRFVNAGVSGDTTAGGLRRLDWLLRQQPDILMVGLGGNDGLRALDVEKSEENLRRIVEGAQAAGARVLLAGMLVPPNYGPEYAERFAAVYPRLAEETGAAFLPFLLEGVAADPELNQADGIHPNAEGQRRVAELVARYLGPLIEAVVAEEAPPTVPPAGGPVIQPPAV